MQIQLCEDDGLFHGGVPQIVILLVKFDDGKTKRIPYPADKTISALYQDLQAIAPQVAEASQTVIEEITVEQIAQIPIEVERLSKDIKPRLTPYVVDKSNVIEKEDIVTLIKLNPRDTTYSGTESPLVVGMDYRVIKVIGPKIPTPDGKGIKQIIQGFEVIDDHAPTPERMVVTVDEVQLKSKRLSAVIAKVNRVEELPKIFTACPALMQYRSPVSSHAERQQWMRCSGSAIAGGV